MASLVIANGSGLFSGVVGASNNFTVHTGRSGIGDLSVYIQGPSRAEVKYEDNHDGTIKVSYVVQKKGDYKINIRYDGVPIPRSPFNVSIRGEEPRRFLTSLPHDNLHFSRSSKMVKVSGRGIFTGLTMINNEIIVDTSQAAPGRLTWIITGPGHVEYFQEIPKNGIHKLYYRPYQPGEYTIHIKYAEREVLGSPYTVRVY